MDFLFFHFLNHQILRMSKEQNIVTLAFLIIIAVRHLLALKSKVLLCKYNTSLMFIFENYLSCVVITSKGKGCRNVEEGKGE